MGEKLVRDLIPDSASSAPPRRAKKNDIRAFLAAKVVEEAAELAEQILKSPEGANPDGVLLEISDLYEILSRVERLYSLTAPQIADARREKIEKRGGFETDRILSVSSPLRRVANGGDVPLRPSLLIELARCRRADLAVAFLKERGVGTILPALREALSRGSRIRLLTTDYLGATDPHALSRLLALSEEFSRNGQKGSLEVRCFLEAPPGEIFRGFHPKAYLFERENGRRIAFVGSSNLSSQALEGNVEWNVFLRETDLANPVDQLEREFEKIFVASRSVPVDSLFVEDYRRRRRVLSPAAAEGEEGPVSLSETGPCPNSVQEEVLLSLALLREDGAKRALTILATGMGKTYLAAFDSREFRRVLFLAHRREILDQARETFLRVRPGEGASFVGDGVFDLSGPLVFAQVQTLSRPDRLAGIAPDAFDYIVVDECHHAEADSYRRILDHFTPLFVLGLTATPYRTDNGDIFGLMDGHVACRRTFFEGISRGLLVPFEYFGLKDTVDFDPIPWRGGRYDPDALERALIDSRRAEETLRAYREHAGTKTLAFCASRLHAEMMSKFFQGAGIASDFLTGDAPSDRRRWVLERFRGGDLSILFVVDLFNEGVDIPEVDRVMLLRPTVSPTIFLQQIGRGLRLSPHKSRLTILDFIGNHKRAHYVLPVLAGREPKSGDWASDAKAVLKQYKANKLDLPPGVRIEFAWEAIDLLESRILQAEPRESVLLTAYEDLWESLGHRPTLLEMAKNGDVSSRDLLSYFGSWQTMLESLEKRRSDRIVLQEFERRLFSEAGDFFREIERTNMSKSYKMVVLSVWLERDGGLALPISLQDLSAGFRTFFNAPLYRRDLVGTPILDLDHVTDRTLEAYVQKNPVNAWVGEKSQGDAFFQYDKASKKLSFSGKGVDLPGFHEAVQERVAYRLFDYFQRRVGVQDP